MEVILYSKECNWYTRCSPLNGGVCYRECPLYIGSVALIDLAITLYCMSRISNIDSQSLCFALFVIILKYIIFIGKKVY